MANGAVQQNMERLSAVFPEVVSEVRLADGRIERRVDFDILCTLLGAAAPTGEERYRFTWPGKADTLRGSTLPTPKKLRPKMSESKNWNTTRNLYIEGDNQDALKLLQEGFAGQVGLVYIDPPYNTGKKLFVYADDFAREAQPTAGGGKAPAESRLHSHWCSQIYGALLLARPLMADHGAILINMDENEIANLHKICAEVFGEENDLGTIVWDKRNPKGDARGISCQHEYILAFAKNKTCFLESHPLKRPKKNAQAMLEKAAALFARVDGGYTLKDANREFSAWLSGQGGLSGGERAYNKIDENGRVYRAVSMAWPNKRQPVKDHFLPLIHPVTQKPCTVPKRGWRNSSSTMRDLQARGLILFGKDERTQPTRKYYLQDNLYENLPSLLYHGGSDVELLAKMGIPFETPKVVEICKEHIEAFSFANDTVLDFYSGSATVAHAVMELNAETGATRRFVMVQLPEECPPDGDAFAQGFSTICDIGKARIRKAGDMLAAQHGQAAPGLDTGFQVYSVECPTQPALPTEDAASHPVEDAT